MRSRRPRAPYIFVLSALAALSLGACESETGATGPEGVKDPAINQVVTAGPLNASSSDTLVYFSFSEGKLVARTADWDIALRRFEVRLNSGVTGTKGVLGYSLQNNKAATSADVLAFTPENTLAAFDAIREADIPGASLFTADRLVENNSGYVNFAGGAPTANASLYWKVRTADGGFALARVTAIVYNEQGSLTSITIESRLQTGATVGAIRQAVVPITGAPVHISLVTNAAVTPSGCNWDLQVDPQSFAITANGACNAGTYPGPASPTFDAAPSASDAPQYAAFLSELTGPIPNSIDDPSAPFRYNLQNTNRLHPAFNTYLILSGTEVWKLQVINYYSEAGASGFPTLRYARIR